MPFPAIWNSTTHVSPSASAQRMSAFTLGKPEYYSAMLYDRPNSSFATATTRSGSNPNLL